MRYLIAQITPAIDFDRLKDVIPSLKSEFIQGASEVYPTFLTVLKYIYVIAGLLLLFYLIADGLHMMTTARDEKGLVEAEGKIAKALVGFLFLFLVYWIVQIMEHLLGIKIF